MNISVNPCYLLTTIKMMLITCLNAKNDKVEVFFYCCELVTKVIQNVKRVRGEQPAVDAQTLGKVAKQ